MLGIILIYFIGKRYYDLAEKYQQNKWFFAILGVILYYLTSIIIGAILGILDVLLSLNIDFDNIILMSIFSLIFGLSTVIIIYNILEKKWKKESIISKDEIENIGGS